MRNYGMRQIQSTARILLICPDCGQENSEFADSLRGLGTYYCNGEDCDYIFDLARRRRSEIGRGFVDTCKRLFGAIYAVRG